MRLKTLLIGAVASSLIATPVMANSASSLSVAKAMNAKASSPSKKSNGLAGVGVLPFVIAGVAVAAVAVGVAAAADDDDETPASN